jgi:hypothetical protein
MKKFWSGNTIMKENDRVITGTSWGYSRNKNKYGRFEWYYSINIIILQLVILKTTCDS